MYLARDIPAFIMYRVYGASRSFLLIEFKDSMIYKESFDISYSLNLTFYIRILEMRLLSLLVETGQRSDAGLTQADNTCIQLNFYLEILKGVHLGFKGGQKPLNATLYMENAPACTKLIY